MVFIETERLIVRNFKKEDFDKFYRYRNDKECSKYQRWNDNSYNGLKRFMQGEMDKTLDSSKIQLAISKKDGELVGDIFLGVKRGTATLGYTISKESQRNGYAFECLESFIKYILLELDLDEIVCLVHPDNERSINLLKKLNFKSEGFEKKLGSLVFSLENNIEL